MRSFIPYLFGLVVAAATLGCSQPGAYVVEEPPVYGQDGTSLVVGTAMVITPYLSTDEIEGGPDITSVDDIRSDDPSILRLEFTTHVYELSPNQTTRGVVVYAMREGSTNLRLFNGDSDEGTLPFTVVAAGH